MKLSADVQDLGGICADCRQKIDSMVSAQTRYHLTKSAYQRSKMRYSNWAVSGVLGSSTGAVAEGDAESRDRGIDGGQCDRVVIIVYDVFDCSEKAAHIAWFLSNKGFNVSICEGTSMGGIVTVGLL